MVAYAPSKSLTLSVPHSEEDRPMLKRYLLAPGPTEDPIHAPDRSGLKSEKTQLPQFLDKL